MSLAYAASELTIASTSRQLTLSTALLLGLAFVAMAAIAIGSWLYRRRLDTRRRDAEIALRASLSRLAQLSNQLPIALFSFRPGIGFDAVSEGIARLLPVTAQQLLTDPSQLLNAIEPEDHAGLDWLRVDGKCPPRLEWLGRTAGSSDSRDGKAVTRWLQMRGAADIGPDGQHLLAGIIVDVTPLISSQKALETSREELRRLAAYREGEREKEYRRLAREFHDELGQLLTSARMQLQWLDSRLAGGGENASETRTALAPIEAMIGDAYRSVKSIAAELRPPALNLGLPAAIEWQAGRMLTPAGLQFTSSLAPISDSLPDVIATALFRIVQEAFTNILRYAGANSVHVSLRQDAPGQLSLSIADDGCGFNPAAIDPGDHFGLVGMRERAAALDGLLDIDSSPGEGTRVTVRLPFSPTPAPGPVK
jgi:signal transduction histidine kinase